MVSGNIFFYGIKDRLPNLVHLVTLCLEPLDWFEVKDFKSYDTGTSSHPHEITGLDLLRFSSWAWIGCERSYHI